MLNTCIILSNVFRRVSNVVHARGEGEKDEMVVVVVKMVHIYIRFHVRVRNPHFVGQFPKARKSEAARPSIF